MSAGVSRRRQRLWHWTTASVALGLACGIGCESNIYGTEDVRIVEYLDVAGASPFKVWFDDLDLPTAARVAKILTRMAQGNLSDVKSVGRGVLEKRIDFGPGYRLYFGREGEALIILLAGGTKRRQQDDIRSAQVRWADYERRRSRA